MRRLALLAALSALGQAARAQLPPVVVRDAGPGPTGRYLAAVLAKPETRVLMVDTLAITRDSLFPGSVVVIGKHVTLSGEIRGDLVVVGGNLFIKPNASILGQGVAIGGGAYGSLLANVRDGLVSFRDFTFDVERKGTTIELRYRETYVTSGGGMLSLPGVYGIRIPRYDRTQGLSLAAGPMITIDEGRMELETTVTYRSHPGRIDPAVKGIWRTGRKFWMTAFAGREARTNDAWITGGLSNSFNMLLSGKDSRNWYRATAVEAQAHRLFETPTVTSVYRLGGQFERASSTGSGPFPNSAPWTITGRDSTEGAFRPNPQIRGGTISSVKGGANYRWASSDVKAQLDVGAELPLSTPFGERFLQTTIDGQVSFPTFGLQRYRFEAHAILTAGDTASAQRFGYLGGSGSIPTEDLLVFGGDQLLFFESRYEIPLPAVRLPFVGSPTVMFRHILGSAGIQALPSLTQVVGLRLSIPFARTEVLMDVKTRRTELKAGLSLTR